MLFPVKNKLLSSANKSKKADFAASGKSFMYIRNNNGPRIDPCGTPHLMFKYFDLAPL